VHGFESSASADGNIFTDNWVSDAGAQGFRMGGSGNTFTGNDSHRNGGFGFEDFSVPEANTYSDNRCIRNGLGESQPAGLCNPSGTFTDDDGNTFEVDIEWMRWAGITLGCNPAGTLFCPSDSVTRGQMASFLVRALDLPSVAGNRFTDVSGTHTANINALAQAGVTLGCNKAGTLFCPNDKVTREQMGSFLARALELPAVAGNRFSDVSGSHTANINAIAEAGITLGCNPAGTLFCPREFVTRGQMAAFLHRGLG
jgi:hypothetical protein